MTVSVRQHFDAVLGDKGDRTVREYVIRCLEDVDFHLGEDGEEAFDAFAPVLVRYGCEHPSMTARQPQNRLRSTGECAQMKMLLQRHAASLPSCSAGMHQRRWPPSTERSAVRAGSVPPPCHHPSQVAPNQ